jgi:hypothetical protein
MLPDIGAFECRCSYLYSFVNLGFKLLSLWPLVVTVARQIVSCCFCLLLLVSVADLC